MYMNSEDLIALAAKTLHPHTSGDRMLGDVAAAIVDEHNAVHVGVCIDTPSWGICAERSALAAMVTQKVYRFKRVAAVWRDKKDGKLYVLPPCGYCRQFMRDIDEANLESEVILGKDTTVKLKDMLPYYEWPQPLD